jgi:hypothetical protein
MAITKSLTSGDSSVTLTLMGFGTINGDRNFYFYIDGEDGYSDYENMKVAGSKSTVTCTFTGLTAGTNYTIGCEMTAPIGSVWNYGPYDIKTTGSSPYEVTGKPSIWFVSGNSIYVRFTGMNSTSDSRQVVIGCKKSTDDYTKYDYSYGGTIPANSTNTSPYFTVDKLEEKTVYDISVEIMYNGESLESWYLTAETSYMDGGNLSCSQVTEKGCTLTVTGVPGTTKYPRTLYWYGKEGTNGDWELLATTTAISEAPQTHSLNSLLPLTHYSFEVRVFCGGESIETLTASCTTSSISGKLSVSEETEYSAKVTLTGLSTGVSYVRRIKWYYKASTDSAYTQYPGVTTVPQSSSSAAIVIDSLISSTSYAFKAEVCDSDDRVLATVAASSITKDTVAQITVESVTSASVKIAVHGMSDVSYTRSFEWLYKRQDEVDYVKFDETQLPASDTFGYISKVFKPLKANTHYDFRVRIKKDGVPMKELSVKQRTALDNSLVPDVVMERIDQEIGSLTVKVYWDSPAHDAGTYYQMQYSIDNENFENIGPVLTAPPSAYTEITLPAVDTQYFVQVMSYMEVDGDRASKFSKPLPVYIFSAFRWDTEKVQGKDFRIGTDEWNRFTRAVQDRLKHLDVDTGNYEFTPAIKGKNFIAEQFNQVLRALNEFNLHNLEEVKPGDAVTAGLLNDIVRLVNLE